MHDVANVEAEDPVVVAEILHAEGATSSDLEFLLNLQLIHLLVGLERDLQPLFLSHPVLEEVATLLEVELADRPELLLNANELVDDIMRFVDLLLEDLDSLGDVLGAATIRGGRAVAAAFANATLASTTEGRFHAQVLTILSSIVFVVPVIGEERIQEVTSQSLCPTELVIASIEIHGRLFKAESVDSFKTFSFILSLLWVSRWEVAECKATVIEHVCTAALHISAT